MHWTECDIRTGVLVLLFSCLLVFAVGFSCVFVYRTVLRNDDIALEDVIPANEDITNTESTSEDHGV